MLPYINTPFEYLGGKAGTSADELKLVTTFYLSFPLAAALKRIPDSKTWQKNLFVIGVSMFYLVGLFDMWDGLRTLTISATGAYLIASRIDSPFMPWIGFVFLMGHMSISHIYRQNVADPTKTDITGAQMVLVMKLTAFCWNVQDGRLPKDELSEFQRDHAIRTLPSLIDYAGFVFFFPAVMAGPAFDYCDYSDYITANMFTLPPGTDPSQAPPTRKKRKIPRSGWPAAMKAIYGTLWLVAFLKFSAWYPKSFFLGKEYMSYNLARRIWQLYMLGLTTRMKYYAVWTLSEGACVLSGIGYNGLDPVTKRPRWDRLTNIKPWEIETAQNARAYLGFWNINTNQWLRNYMYLRVTPKGQKPGFRATLATFVTSAFWHGFYPGYYLAFVLASFVQTAAKNGRRLIRPLFLSPDGKKDLPSKRYYDAATCVFTQVVFAFVVAPFILLGFSDTLKVWARVYFYDLIGLAASFAIFSRQLPLRKQLVQRQKARVAVAPINEKAIKEAAEEEVKRDHLSRTNTQDTASRKQPILGIADDIDAEIDEIVREVKTEFEERRRRGSFVQGFDIKKSVQEKLKQFKKS